VAQFVSAEERSAWSVAEALLDKATGLMRQAEGALEKFSRGKELMVQRCARRGISRTDAEIRWAETVEAKKAIGENSVNVTLANMYFGAAAAHYSRAGYLRLHR
jgi:hypothetical protein